ncbi:barstar family protein [Micromonospora auratinigra]|uniref:Barstar (Barnase inhibitor) n=1 Tax=Micromonospora auratinigra TaxID=261654 RepID=A0A1A8ZF42_9ACTN|nr:barstar family protein [Micromonospora auratinigra]SBT42456.1 Barstar (barnase inhibitor) [Micromonospora auratinigra]
MAATNLHLPAWLVFDGDPDGVEVDATAARTRAGLFDALTATLALPDHFGRNWDALADVLADRLDAGPLTLRIRDAGLLLADEPPAQLGTLLDVFGGVAAGGHHALRVVLHEHPGRRAALRQRITAALT